MYLKKRYLLLILLLGAIVVGPRSHFEPVGTVLPQLELDLEEVEAFVAHQEAHLQNLKPDNGSRIVWADSLRRTPYAVVYLHGFSASPVEGAPLHREFARRYGCNLYLPRLAGHGLDDRESFVDLTPEALMASAREALAIGQVLGEKVILMSCSTGSTLSAFLAAAQPEAVDALLMYSPNFALENPATQLLTGPWGLQIARATIGGKYRSIQLPENCHPYWTITYRVEGLVALQGLLDQTMNEKTYRGVMQPFFLGYYYKNEEARDQVISIDEIQRFAETSATPADQRRLVAFPEAGGHIITSDLQSKDLESVRRETYKFAEEVLKLAVLKPVGESTTTN